jgi:6-phosphogluconolactonase (cycloisomerase 2 family)
VTNEAGNNVTAYTINASTFALTPLSGSPFVSGTSPQSVTVDLAGLYLYVVNQISNDVWVCSIDPTTGTITPVAGSPFSAGTNPFGIAASGTIQ